MKNILITLLSILILWSCSGKTGSETAKSEPQEAETSESAETIPDAVTDQMATEAENLKQESQKLEQKADSLLNSI